MAHPAVRTISAYERERDLRIRENNRLLKSLGLLATDFSLASPKEAMRVLDRSAPAGTGLLAADVAAAPVRPDLAGVRPARSSEAGSGIGGGGGGVDGRPLVPVTMGAGAVSTARLSFAIVPPLECVREADLPAYRRAVVLAARDVSERLCVGG